jgi:ferritin-like metal-binding protein YciE
MPAPQNLRDVYMDELRDLWSANDQMHAVVKDLIAKAKDARLKETLQNSVGRIAEHTATLKSLLTAAGGEVSKEHCRAMEGLVREARVHILEEATSDGVLKDLLIIAQYQRMSHYGLAGFGTAAAYAKALGRSADAAALQSTVSDIYRGDEIATRLAERLEESAAT